MPTFTSQFIQLSNRRSTNLIQICIRDLFNKYEFLKRIGDVIILVFIAFDGTRTHTKLNKNLNINFPRNSLHHKLGEI